MSFSRISLLKASPVYEMIVEGIASNSSGLRSTATITPLPLISLLCVYKDQDPGDAPTSKIVSPGLIIEFFCCISSNLYTERAGYPSFFALRV